MEIIPHIGFGEIRLGLSRSEIKTQLGRDFVVRTEEFSDGSECEVWEYQVPAVRLSFYSEDGGKLGTITVEDTDALFGGKPIISEEVDDFVRTHPEFSLEDDFEENGQDYTSDELGMSVWALDGTIVYVSIFPDWQDDEKPIWPKARSETKRPNQSPQTRSTSGPV